MHDAHSTKRATQAEVLLQVSAGKHSLHLQDQGVGSAASECVTVGLSDLIQRIAARPDVRKTEVLIGVANACEQAGNPMSSM